VVRQQSPNVLTKATDELCYTVPVSFSYNVKKKINAECEHEKITSKLLPHAVFIKPACNAGRVDFTVMKRSVMVVLQVHEFNQLFNFLMECFASKQAEREILNQVEACLHA